MQAVGDLDLASAPAFRRELRAAVDRAGSRPMVVVDLSAVDLFDSVSLGILLGVERRVREGSGRLRVLLEGERVRRTLELTRTAELFDIVGTIEAAVAD